MLSIEISLVCLIGSHFIVLVNKHTILIGIQVNIKIGKVKIPDKIFFTCFLLYFTINTVVAMLNIYVKTKNKYLYANINAKISFNLIPTKL